MRSFSKLKAFCSYPETIPQKPSKRRDDAAEIGTMFHKYIEEWAKATAAGTPFHCDGAPEPVRTWIRRMRGSWTPPAGLETELPLGLEDLPFPQYVEVTEPEPHVYVPVDANAKLLTGGRADLVWVADRVLHVPDIKTGQFYLGPPARLRQLQAQGFSAFSRQNLRAPGSVDAFKVGIYYARTGHFDWSDPVGPGTEEWAVMWRECLEAAKRDQKPRPGPHCLSCWDRKECPSNPEAQEAA
jgi:hypothetical protein